MKAIFKALLTKLNQDVSELKWIDWDKGQLDGDERPEVSWPCCLINIELPRTTSMNAKQTLQNCDAVITLTVGWNFDANSYAGKSEAIIDKSLEWLDVLGKIFNSLQGYEQPEFTPFERISEGKDLRKGGYNIRNLVYTTSFKQSAS